MIPRVPGVIQMALIDAISAQHQILGMDDGPATEFPSARWARGAEGKRLAVSGILDIPQLAMDLKASMDSVANRDDGKLQREADWVALDFEAAIPERESGDPICRHCGLLIESAVGKGNGWRHSATGFLGCEPDHKTLGEP